MKVRLNRFVFLSKRKSALFRFWNPFQLLCGVVLAGITGHSAAQLVPDYSRLLPIDLPSLNLPALSLPQLLSPKDAFYDPPSSLPAGGPGTIIRSRKLALSTIPIATVHQIMFISTNVQGERIPVTGAVLVPTLLGGSGENRALVAFAPGTRGMGDQCATSKQLNPLTISPLFPDVEIGTLYLLLLRGYTVAITDHPGAGTSIPEPYLVAKAEAYGVLDAARAATRLPGSGVGPKSSVAVMGYSQGGQTAAAAAEVHPRYAPDLNLKGVAAGGVPSDMLGMVDYWKTPAGRTINSGFLMASLVGLDNAYPQLNLAQYTTRRGAELFKVVKQSCSSQYLTLFPLVQSSELTEPDVTTLPNFRAAYAESAIGKIKPAVPVYLYHGTLDNIVPYGAGAGPLFKSWCSLGANVQLVNLPAEHVTPVVLGVPGALNFIAARFAGAQVVNDCK